MNQYAPAWGSGTSPRQIHGLPLVMDQIVRRESEELPLHFLFSLDFFRFDPTKKERRDTVDTSQYAFEVPLQLDPSMNLVCAMVRFRIANHLRELFCFP
jgi:hypothetical protein